MSTKYYCYLRFISTKQWTFLLAAGVSGLSLIYSSTSSIGKLKAYFCGHEKEGHFHYKNLLIALKLSYLLHHPKIPLLWIGIKPNPQQRDLGMIKQESYSNFIFPI